MKYERSSLVDICVYSPWRLCFPKNVHAAFTPGHVHSMRSIIDKHTHTHTHALPHKTHTHSSCLCVCVYLNRLCAQTHCTQTHREAGLVEDMFCPLGVHVRVKRAGHLTTHALKHTSTQYDAWTIMTYIRFQASRCTCMHISFGWDRREYN